MNILIIEDDVILAEGIKKVFQERIISNRVKIASSYKEFLFELKIIRSYDIILIDIVLEKWCVKNWIDIVKIIRREDKCIPVIIISGHTDLIWLENAFNSWASDYIIKPFRLKELELRIFKWFKIYFYSDKSNNCKEINYYWLRYDLNENIFYFYEQKIDLTKANKYLLSIFLSSPEKLFRQNLLIEKIWWDISFLLDRNLRIVVLRLKTSLKQYWLDSRIQNIRGEWYMLKKDD